MKTAVALATILVLGSWQLGPGASVARADAPATIELAIPQPPGVEIVVGAHLIVFIGKPTSTSPVNCAPGTPQPQTVVALDPGVFAFSVAQITGVLAFHDHEIPNGTRYRITGGPNPCNTDFRRYTGTLE